MDTFPHTSNIEIPQEDFPVVKDDTVTSIIVTSSKLTTMLQKFIKGV